MQTIADLERRVGALYPASDSITPKRIVCYLMIAKHGPKIESVFAETGYDRQFIADAITRLRDNDQLITGVLDRAYLKHYLKGNLSILDEVLGASNTMPAPVAKPSTVRINDSRWTTQALEVLDLSSLTLEQCAEICRARKIHQGMYADCLPVEKRILNRWATLKKQAKRMTAPQPETPQPKQKRGLPQERKERRVRDTNASIVREAILAVAESKPKGFSWPQVADWLREKGYEGVEQFKMNYQHESYAMAKRGELAVIVKGVLGGANPQMTLYGLPNAEPEPESSAPVATVCLTDDVHVRTMEALADSGSAATAGIAVCAPDGRQARTIRRQHVSERGSIELAARYCQQAHT